MNNNFIENGRLLHSDTQKVWSAYDPKLLPWIIRLTEKFDLTFSVPDRKLNLVPCLMPDQSEESFEWPECPTEMKESQLVYEFEYLPAGLFNRTQVRLFQLTDNKSIWKNGSVLSKNNHLALITRNDNKINIKVNNKKILNLCNMYINFECLYF